MPIPTQRDASNTRMASEPMSRYDWLLLALFVAMFFFITWFRRHGIFWNDEIMGWTTLDQPTWRDVIRVWLACVDSSGFFFYVFARPWLQLFGWTELSLHLWTTTFTSAAFILVWIVTRRFASLSIVAIAAPALTAPTTSGFRSSAGIATSRKPACQKQRQPPPEKIRERYAAISSISQTPSANRNCSCDTRV